MTPEVEVLVQLAVQLAVPLAVALAVVTGDPGALRLLRSPDGEVPERVAGLRVVGAFEQASAVRLVFTLSDDDPTGRNLVEFLLNRRDDSEPAWERTASYDVTFRGPTAGGKPAPQVADLAAAVLESIRRNEDATAPPLAAAPFVDRPGSREAAAWVVLNRATAATGVVLVVVFLLLAPATGRRLWADLSSRLGPAAWVVLAIAAAAITARLLLPHRPVMYYMGYRLAESAATLGDVPKYGPGALAAYHLLFLATGTSHVAMAHLNSVLGGLLPIPAAALMARAGAGRAGALAAAAMLAGVPLFVKDATTESLLVPTVLWAVTGLALVLRWRETRATSDLALALLPLLLAMESRPEAVALVPATVLLVAWQGRAGPRAAGSRAGDVAAWAIAAVLLAARVAHMLVAVGIERARGAAPVLGDPAALVGLADGLWTRNVAFRADFFPVAVTVLAGAAVVAGGRVRAPRAAALLVAASLWLLASLVDLPYVSLPRVQVPALVLVTLAAAWGADAAWALAARLPGAARVAVMAAVAVAVAAASAPTVEPLWARTNADDEEDLIRDAIAALPAEPATVVRRAYEDLPAEPVHLSWPDYLFEAAGHRALGPDRYEATAEAGGRPAYFLLGTRCWLRACGQQGMHPACARMAERHYLEPVVERTVPVRVLPVDRARAADQDLDFPWCVAAPGGEMKIGLYRVR
ncbi:MAG: hypothetical protein FJ087_06580 [Deltaproteobacteria bacterium]|nr:hypothetical protein [Deltaproteobacteria bacterium]